jgi:putative spermidine/putrescine transport system permease protein
VEAFFYIAVMLPMWASYIVKAYAWTLLLAKDGVAQWFLSHLGLEPILTSLLTLPAIGGNTLSTSGLGRFLVFVYIWLPFMILPVQAALERLPLRCCRPQPIWARVRARPSAMWFCRWRSRALPRVDFHLLPDAGGLYRSAAGGAAGLLYRQHGLLPAGAIGNMPMAAAFTLVPIVLISLYLAFVKRLGAFDAL